MTIAASLPLGSPDIFHRFRALAYTLVLLAVAGFAYAEPNSWLFILILAAAVMSWWLVESRPRSPGLPRALINAGVLLVAAVLFAELVVARQPNLLLALGHFMIGILARKLFERKGIRDYAQILTLTLLIMVAGAIVSASLTFAVLLVAYLALGLYAILLLHLNAETERARSAQLIPAGLPSSFSMSLALRKDIRRVAGFSSLLLVGIAALVFLAIPRSRGGFFSNQWSLDAASRTGFSDRVRFSDYTSLQQSDAIVMEVRLEQDGTNIGSESFQPYFRGMALDTYDLIERQWSRGPTGENVHRAFADKPDYLVPSAEYSPIGMITQQYTMHSYTGNTLFTLATPVIFNADHDLDVTFSPADSSINIQSASPQLLHYDVASAIIYKPDQPAPLLVMPAGGLGYLNRGDGTMIVNQVPAEIRSFAHRILRGLLPDDRAPTPEQIRPIADLIQEYLRSHYPYSLNFETKDTSLDPTADFLLNRQDTGGHCEYFASAMVMLCRSVGLNARMVTGYHGGDFNAISGLYVVRQKDAHAWVEVCLPGRGWVTYDPSPAATNGPPFLIATWFRDITEIVQKGWQSTIIAFDNSSRSYIFNAISGFLHSNVQAAREIFAEATEGVGELLFTTPFVIRMVTAGSLLLLGALLAWLIHHLHRRRTSQLNYILRNVDRKVQRQLAHELLFFDELLRLLTRTGFRKRVEQTPREYIDALSPSLRAAAPDARWLVATFYDVRFGAVRVTATLRAQIAAALHHVREQLHGQLPQ